MAPAMSKYAQSALPGPWTAMSSLPLLSWTKLGPENVDPGEPI